MIVIQSLGILAGKKVFFFFCLRFASHVYRIHTAVDVVRICICITRQTPKIITIISEFLFVCAAGTQEIQRKRKHNGNWSGSFSSSILVVVTKTFYTRRCFEFFFLEKWNALAPSFTAAWIRECCAYFLNSLLIKFLASPLFFFVRLLVTMFSNRFSPLSTAVIHGTVAFPFRYFHACALKFIARENGR